MKQQKLFFVDGKHHRCGVGKELMQLVICDNKNGKLTVNSSPYAVDVYKKHGFSPTGPEEVADGIRFTLMEMINCVKSLQETECIDYTSMVIQAEDMRLQEHSCSLLDYIKNAYEFVRDEIPHSWDNLLQSVGSDEKTVKGITNSKVYSIFLIPFVVASCVLLMFSYGTNFTYGYDIFNIDSNIYIVGIL